MSLLADLHAGIHGLQFTPPSSWQLDADQDEFASFRDATHRVDWYLEFSPLIVDLSNRHDEVLREDLRRDTITVFESYFEMGKTESPVPPVEQGADMDAVTRETVRNLLSLPRTKRDPNWSPVVSIERATISGVPVLVVIHRLTYGGGDELIIGRIVISLEQGTVYLSALRRANVTGVRETVLVITRQQPGEDGDPGPSEISQAMIDDPALDEKFPDHPLSAIRRALHWALSTPLTLSILTPLSPEPETPIALPRSGCSIIPPPRFRVCPALETRMDSSLTLFIRATVPQGGSYCFDVWRVPSLSIKGRHATQQLRRVAEEYMREWGRDGDPVVEFEWAEYVMRDGLPGVSTYVSFHVNGHRNHAVANWFVDHDGTVFRVCMGGSISRSREELTTAVNDSTATWHRLPEDVRTRSPWWKLFAS
ncbi:MAG: hypothetical protein JNL29_03595 [Nitrospira sp.]|nr:hypothetical protein [Nitrospira sp.]